LVPLKFNTNSIPEYKRFDASTVSQYTDANDELAWGVAYNAHGVKAFTPRPGVHFCHQRQMWWRVAKWRPDPELYELFQNIGTKDMVGGMIEYWDDDYSGEGLVYRDLFEGRESRRWYM
jgi:hypothetical protein